MERGKMLTDMEEVTKLHRKSLVRLMHMPSLERAPRRPRCRRRRYGAAVADVARVVWECLDYVCAERLTLGLLSTAQQLAPGVGAEAGGGDTAKHHKPGDGAATAAAVGAGFPEAAPAQAPAPRSSVEGGAHGAVIPGDHIPCRQAAPC